MQDVEVGDHIPPASGTVDAFMLRFAEAYRLAGVGLGTGIMLMAAAHHRFAFIHPFPDGNGRVGRLISHAMAHKIGIGAHGLWSISRGLARGIAPGLEGRGEYKATLARGDMLRQGDLDGRGNLSERALAEWSLWFVRVCVDQVDFMSGLFDINTLADRLNRYIRRNDKDFQPAAAHILVEALMRGDVERGDAARITGMPERSARRVVGQLLDKGLLESGAPRAPLRLAFPPDALDDLFPRLFPAQ
jgi:Fic family protein